MIPSKMAQRYLECGAYVAEQPASPIGAWNPEVHGAINHVHMALVLGQLGCPVVVRAAQQSPSDWRDLARLERNRREALSW